MEQNVYAPPASVVMDAPRARTQPEYYVVSTTKFLVLFFATAGMYPLYWFYKHWACYRAYHRESMWPAARAIFAIFFTHSLATEINASLGRAQVRHAWSPGLLATGYVIFAIIGSVCDRLSLNEIGSPYTDLIGLATLLPMAGFLLPIQRAANLACNQPDADSNRRFTWANWLWIVFGCLFWLLILIGLADALGAPLFPAE